MIKADKYYKDNLRKIISEGCYDINPRPRYKDGTPAHSKFITQVFEKYDISKAQFPITTLRNTAIKTGIQEILWIYQKQSNDLNVAKELNITWWNDWEVSNTNTIGQRYGATVKKYNLINNLLDNLKKDPFGRRHILSLYQYSDFNETEGLHPCAYETLWSVRDCEGYLYLDLTLVQRSNDYIIAGYINKIQYVALQMMIASHLNYKVGMFSHLTQNLHVYDRHFDALYELLDKKPLPLDQQPILKLKENKSFYEFSIDDFIIENIDGITKIKSPLEIAV